MKTKFLMIALAVILFSNAQAQVPSYVPTNGLVGWWPFNGNANDESGNGNNGGFTGPSCNGCGVATVTAPPTLTADRFGNLNTAFNFSNQLDLISIPNSSSLQLTNQYSIACWIKPSSFGFGNFGVVLAKWGNTGSASYQLVLTPQGNLTYFTHANSNTSSTTTNSPLIAGTWYSVVITQNNNNVSVFVNGILSGSSSTMLVPGIVNNTLEVGRNLNQFANYASEGLIGDIDDIGIWNRALTQQEITNLYNSSAYVPCASPAFPANLANGLVGYWPFCGDANDESGNGNNGTVNGATLTNDRFGNPNSAYEFDGVNDYVEVVHSSTLSFGTSVTFSFWVNIPDNSFNTTGNPERNPIGKQRSSGLGGSGIQWETNDQIGVPGTPQFYLNSGNSVVQYEDVTPLVLNNWNHLVGVYNGSNLSLYANGALLGSSLGNLSLSNIVQNLFFGKEGSNGRYYKGSIDDIGIWNRALNASEVQQLYNTGIYFQTVTGSCDTLQFNANITGFNPITYQNQVKVFPNPAKDNLVIDCGANFNTLTGFSIKILNTMGQSVYNSLITQQVSTILLSSPTWSPGAYVVQFINPTGTVIEAKQIIIQ